MTLKKITIQECKEPLLELKKICPDLIIRLNSRSTKRTCPAYLRKSVAEMVCRASSFLPEEMTFIVGDTWRSRNVQKQIYESFVKRFAIKNPHWTKDQIAKEVNKYVAPFSGKYTSGHMAGASVDLYLAKNGKRVPMKSSKLSFQENSKSNQSKLPAYIKRNRKIMFEALKKAGLSNYPREYWHWSYGDILWAQRNQNAVAIYGVIELSKSE